MHVTNRMVEEQYLDDGMQALLIDMLTHVPGLKLLLLSRKKMELRGV